jgi:hypothetical protein
MPRATYYVKATVTNPLQDMYLSNLNTGTISQKVDMPYRGALTRVMRIDTPNTVTVSFKTYTGNKTNPITVTPGSTTSSFVGPWVAMNDEILSNPTNEFSTGPGRTYMPHQDSNITNLLFPAADGYSAYAGACNLNDPDDGNNGNGSEWVAIPQTSELGTSVWDPGSTYASGILWLSQIRARIYATTSSKPTGILLPNKTYYWGQTVTSGKVNAKLTGDQGNNSIYTDCGARSSLFNTWQRLPGSVDTSGYLTDSAEAVPTGTYDVCIYAQVKVTSQATNSLGQWTGSPQTTTLNIYRLTQKQTVTYQSSVNPTYDLSSVTASEGSTSTCTGATWS